LEAAGTEPDQSRSRNRLPKIRRKFERRERSTREKQAFRGGILEGGGKNELICSFSLGKVVEAAGVETKVGRLSNLLMARDF
jgi:hypothetical protein